MLSEDPYFEQARDVHVFSRASLRLTFDLLRKKYPQLALDVRNITGGEPLPRSIEETHSYTEDEPYDNNGDNFHVGLDLYQVRSIVQALMEFTQPEALDIKNPEINIMARALMQDWLVLAHHLVTTQPLYPDLQAEVEPQKPM